MQRRPTQPPKKDPPKKEEPKIDTDAALAGVNRFVLQTAASMYINAPELKIDELKGVPDTQWFDQKIKDTRGALVMLGKKAGVKGDTDDEIVKGALLQDIRIPMPKAGNPRGNLFMTNSKLNPEFELKQVELSARKGGNTLIINQMEVLDMAKLIKMDLRTADTDTLKAAPTRQVLGTDIRKFYKEVYEAAAKGGDIKDIYLKKKTALLTKLEAQQKRIEGKGGKIPAEEQIDFDAYKTPVLDRDKKPILDKDSKPKMQYSPEKTIILSMADEGKPDEGKADVKVVTLPRTALDELEDERLFAEGIVTDFTATRPLPPRGESQMLKDKEEAAPKKDGPVPT